MSYIEYFSLRENPFSITPDPRFMYLSEIHKEALDHLSYGASGSADGFVLLTGDVGAGKTTICRTFLKELPPNTEVVLILNPVLSLNEFLQTICDDLRIEVEGSRESNKNLIDHFNRFLLQVYAVGRRTILIVDEAQMLSNELLEQIRLLTNLESDTDKLLRIFLIGQPELRDTLNRSELRQVTQRITSRYHLGPLSRKQTRAYIERRLSVAGGEDVQFTTPAIQAIYRYSQGIPRLINVLSDKALHSAYLMSAPKVNARVVRYALDRLQGHVERPGGKFERIATVAASATVIAASVFLGVKYYQHKFPADAPSKAAEVVQAEMSATIQVDPKPAEAEIASDKAEQVKPTELAALAPEGRKGIALTKAEDDSTISDVIRASTPFPDNEQILATEPASSVDTSRPAIPVRSLAGRGPGSPLTERTRKYAEQKLAELWGASELPDNGQDFCGQVSTQNLNCLYAVGGYTNLAKYNRPAILYLNVGDLPAYAVMMRIGGDKVVLDVLGKEHVLTTDSLQQVWDGRFHLLWRRPNKVSPYIAVGAAGDDAAWLRAVLDQLQGQQSEGNIYDEQLAARVKQFQRESGLLDDGIVGPKTFILLQNQLALMQNQIATTSN